MYDNCKQEGDVCAAVSDTEESEDDLPEPDLTAGNKDACILVVNLICEFYHVLILSNIAYNKQYYK